VVQRERTSQEGGGAVKEGGNGVGSRRREGFEISSRRLESTDGLLGAKPHLHKLFHLPE